MKRAIVIVSLLALLMFAVFAPVLAVQPTVTSMKALQTGSITSIEKEWFSNDIRHRSGVVNEGTIKLFIPATASTPTYTLSYYNVYHIASDQVDLNGPYVVIVDAKWMYKVNGIVVGTFEGQLNWSMDSPMDAHGLLKGTGIFEGWILKFWEDPTTAGTQWYGTVIEKII